MARRYLFICDVCAATVQTVDDSERLPAGWAILSGIRVDSTHVLSIEVCSGECAGQALATPSVSQHLNPAPATPLLPPKKGV